MKILRLDLLAFGPFTDLSLDLSAGKEGLHLLYGLNEAGKSSALRALRQMLYGIPARSSDDFIHPYKKMRIGAVLRHSDGGTIHVIRRKGNANTLRYTGDDTPVDEGWFQDFMGGIGEDVFATVFGIGHAGLVRGGEEIIRGGGDVGRALFAAGAGISGLRKVQAELQSEAEALFTPAASTREINRAISELKEKRKLIREAELPGQEWERHEAGLREALDRREALDKELGGKEAERNRLERIRDALPLISKRKERLEELRSCSGAVLLPEDFADRRHQALAELRVAESTRDQVAKDLEETVQGMERLRVDQALLSRAELIEDCYKELGSIQKAAKDRRDLRTTRDILRAEARDMLSGLRDDLDLDQAGGLKLKKQERVGIQELGKEYERIMERLESARTSVSRAAARLEAVEEELVASRTPADVTRLELALDRASKTSALEGHYHEELAGIEISLRSLETALQRQTLWRGGLEDLERLPLPSKAAMDGFDQRLERAEREISGLRDECMGLEEALAESGRRLDELELEGEVPSEEDLYEARRLREETWSVVRRLLEGNAAPEGGKSSGNPAEAYEGRVRRVDDLADRLRREAERVARKAKLISDKEAGGDRLERVKAKLEAAEAEKEEILASWEGLWVPAGISPLRPREMRAWVQDQEGIRERYSELRERRRKAEDLGRELEASRRELREGLDTLSQEAPSECPSINEFSALSSFQGRNEQFLPRLAQ